MRARRTIAVITALLGLSVVTASPASADVGAWVAYGNKNPITTSSSQWRCATSKVITTGVKAQVCAIRSDGGEGWDVQGAVIVRNDRSSLFGLGAAVQVWDSFNSESLGRWECPSSGVAANSWSVCFGRTIGFANKVVATGDAKGTYLGQTGDI